MKLPLVLSVPHAGQTIPPEAEDICSLTQEDVLADSDEGAREIYDLSTEVAGFVTTDIARAIVDMNRATDDFRRDGVVKTHTCWDVPVYAEHPDQTTVKLLIDKYHRPYHSALTKWSEKGLLMGVDCHTMAAIGPPIGPDSGKTRPAICLSNADGTCPDEWLKSLASILEEEFEKSVSLNSPFKGGYIIKTHSASMPWVQLEHSRDPYLNEIEKRSRTLRALDKWVSLKA